MIGGIIGQKVFAVSDICGSDASPKGAEAMNAKYGIETFTDNKKVAGMADIIVLAVKPIFLQDVIEGIRDGGTFILNTTKSKNEVLSILSNREKNIIKSRLEFNNKIEI